MKIRFLIVILLIVLASLLVPGGTRWVVARSGEVVARLGWHMPPIIYVTPPGQESHRVRNVAVFVHEGVGPETCLAYPPSPAPPDAEPAG
jgi:regulator of protease activity HflC (stomatin/prohibitin superfamily)